MAVKTVVHLFPPLPRNHRSELIYDFEKKRKLHEETTDDIIPKFKATKKIRRISG